MPKTQNLIFPHLDPFSQSWSHIQKGSKSYSIHQHRNLVKPMVIVASDGYIN